MYEISFSLLNQKIIIRRCIVAPFFLYINSIKVGIVVWFFSVLAKRLLKTQDEVFRKVIKREAIIFESLF
jgi:hypothetical protein